MDLYCSALVKKRVINHWSSSKDSLILNLAGLNYLDSSGIGTIVHLHGEARKKGFGFYLAALPAPIHRIFNLTKLIGFLPICDTVGEAVGKLHFQQPDVGRVTDTVGPLLVDSRHRLFETDGLIYRDFNMDLGRIRYISHLLSQQAPAEIREYNLLEQQISEIIKNAVRHGNLNDIRKKVKIWYRFTPESARLIVEDEGEGFLRLEAWNDFFHKRMACFINQDFERMAEFVSYRTENSIEADGGNAMFAAVEYWNEGVVYNQKRNAVAVGRKFQESSD